MAFHNCSYLFSFLLIPVSGPLLHPPALCCYVTWIPSSFLSHPLKSFSRLCPSYISVAVTEHHDRRQHSRERAHCGSLLQVVSITVRKSQHQEPETTGESHQYTDRSIENECMPAQSSANLLCSYASQGPKPGNVPSTFRLESSTSVKAIKTH